MLLEVGTVLYYTLGYSSQSNCKIIIDRVTEKRAFAGKTQFKRDIGNNTHVTAIGDDHWKQTWYYLETEKTKQQYARSLQERNYYALIKKINIKDMPDVKLSDAKLNDMVRYLREAIE